MQDVVPKMQNVVAKMQNVVAKMQNVVANEMQNVRDANCRASIDSTSGVDLSDSEKESPFPVNHFRKKRQRHYSFFVSLISTPEVETFDR